MRRLLRWTFMAALLGVAAWVVRLTVLERQSRQELSTSTAPWPDLPATPAAPAARSVGEPASVAVTDPDPVTAWVEPLDGGGCPASHPVKAKLRSRVFHLPGMVAYDRTGADRCYAGAEAAEADGFRRASR